MDYDILSRFVIIIIIFCSPDFCRSHISSLRDKISTLEEDLYKSSSANYHNLPSKKNSSKKKGISEKRFQKVSLANPIVSPANSDLDLSTSSSSSTSLADFSASEISSYTTKNKQQVSGLFSFILHLYF